MPQPTDILEDLGWSSRSFSHSAVFFREETSLAGETIIIGLRRRKAIFDRAENTPLAIFISGRNRSAFRAPKPAAILPIFFQLPTSLIDQVSEMR